MSDKKIDILAMQETHIGITHEVTRAKHTWYFSGLSADPNTIHTHWSWIRDQERVENFYTGR
jgi:hypothetical protein